MIKVSTTGNAPNKYVEISVEGQSQIGVWGIPVPTSTSHQMTPLEAEALIKQLREAVNSARAYNTPTKKFWQ